MSFIDTFVKNHPVQKLEVDNIVGEYIIGGKGKIGFLIFPGGGQDIYSCFDLINIFEGQYKAIAVNLTGFFSLSSFFKFINQIFKKERIEKVIVYGLSLGGFLAQHYAYQNPEKVIKIILSHTGSTKSKTIKQRIIIPGKILYFLLPVIPISLIKWIIKKLSAKAQAGHSNINKLYIKYSTNQNLKRRTEFGQRFNLNFLNKLYLKSFYKLGMQMVADEKKWNNRKLNILSKKMFIIKTDNDPLASDDGIFKEYYPHAKVHSFRETGHLTPFIQFERMVSVIKKF